MTILDPKTTRRRLLARTASTYSKAAYLPNEIADRLFEHLLPIKLEPQFILDLGAKTGHSSALLRQRYPNAQIISLEMTVPLLQQIKTGWRWWRKTTRICADYEKLPFLTGQIDAVFANLSLLWCDDLSLLLQEIRRVLRPEGLFLFSSLGPDSLREIRQSWAQVDTMPHVHSLVDMHDIGDQLLQAQFLDPVMEMEYLTLEYQSTNVLFQDLKALGWQNIAADRRKTLTGKQRWQHFLQQYSTFQQADGVFPTTLEIIYGHAWAPSVGHAIRTADGEIRISVESLQVNFRKQAK